MSTVRISTTPGSQGAAPVGRTQAARPRIIQGSAYVTGTGTMVTDGFPLGLVWFQDTSLVAVALLCMQEVSFDT